MASGVSSPKLILASHSPRRRVLLEKLGLPFLVIVSNVSEEIDEPLESIQTAERLALLKAQVVAATHPKAIVMGADTLIDFEGEVVGKPADRADARAILSRLRGRDHQVITAVVAIKPDARAAQVQAVTTTVKMRAFSDIDLERYLASGEPMGKAGAYAIQGRGAHLVDSIVGCYFNVVGFPLCEVARLLQWAGLELEDGGAVCQTPQGQVCPRVKGE